MCHEFMYLHTSTADDPYWIDLMEMLWLAICSQVLLHVWSNKEYGTSRASGLTGLAIVTQLSRDHIFVPNNISDSEIYSAAESPITAQESKLFQQQYTFKAKIASLTKSTSWKGQLIG